MIDDTVHYTPLRFQCPRAQTLWARGTDDPEEVTCCRCYDNMVQSTVNHIYMPDADEANEAVCPVCRGGQIDPTDVKRWCLHCGGSGRL